MRPVFPFPQFSWINQSLPRQQHRTDLSGDELNSVLLDSYAEYKNYQHLLYITWKRQCAGYVAANVEQAMKGPRPYHISMLLAESTSISLRSSMRVRETEQLQLERLKVELKKNKSQINEKDLESALEAMTINDSKTPKEFKILAFPTGYFDGSKEFMNFIKCKLN